MPSAASMPGDQCNTGNVLPLCGALVLLVAWSISLRKHWVGSVASGAALVFLFFYTAYIQVVAPLAIMHLLVGAIAYWAAHNYARTPLIALGGWGEFLLVVLCILPNLQITLTQTIIQYSADSMHYEFAGMALLMRRAFFEKQHAALHAALCVLLGSMLVSFRPSWRRNPRVQEARMLTEPACLATIAFILMAHSHGGEVHELESHPLIGALMCVCAAVGLCSAGAHLSAGCDLCAPGSTSPALRVMRLVTAFAYLMLANFLWIDTFMQYLDCREVIIKTGKPGDESRIGYSPSAELSTYLATSTMLSALAFCALVVCSPAGAVVEAEPETKLPLRGASFDEHVPFSDGCNTPLVCKSDNQAADEP